MIATDLIADPRRSAKLTHDDDAAILVQPAHVQILDQGAQTPVEDWKIFRLAIENGVIAAAVPVPLAVVERDDAHARLDQPPRHEHALRHARAPLPSIMIAGSPVP